MCKFFRIGLTLIFTFVFQTVYAAEPKVRFVDGSDDYRTARGTHLIVHVDIRNRWNGTTRFKLNGYLEDYTPNGVCLVYGNDDKCFQVEDSYSQIVRNLDSFNTKDKEGITDACAVISSDYENLVGKLRNKNARRLLELRQADFENFSRSCLKAIYSSFPGTRFADASASVLGKGKANTENQLSASSFTVVPYDGRKNGANYTGAWITLNGIKLDGNQYAKGTVAFEFGGNYGSDPDTIGFSSVRTFTNMPSSAGEQRHQSLGNRFFLDARSSQEAKYRYSQLNVDDQLIMQGVCGLMSDLNFVNEVLLRMINSKPYSYSDYVDDKYNAYWSSYGRSDQVLKIANACNRGIGNAAGEKIAVKVAGSGKKRALLCGLPTGEVIYKRNELIAVQDALKAKGYYRGAIDGIMGRGSCGGLVKYLNSERKVYRFDRAEFNALLKQGSSDNDTIQENTILTFKDYELRPVDGRAEGRNIIGSWVMLKGVQINGKPFAKQDIWLEFLGTFDTKRIDMIGFSSKQTFTNMPTKIGEKFGNPNLGYGFSVRYNGLASARSRFNELNDVDRRIVKGICGLMADERFVEEVVTTLANQKPWSFRDYIDTNFMDFWKTGQKVKNIIQVANACNAALGNTGADRIAFTSLRAAKATPAPSATTNTDALRAACNQNRAIIRSNQTVLKDLGFYTSVIDGLSGPNYRRAVRSGEQLLGTRADDKVGCLNVPERQILSSIYDASRKGSQCKSIMTVDEVKTTFEQLKASELTKKISLGYANVGGLMWMIDTVSDLEKRLSFTDFYKATKTSKRDCRLDRDELDALAPKEPVTLSLAATNLSIATLVTDSGTTLRLTAGGNDIETSKMSKSVFGGSNQASMDVQFTTFNGNPVLDFVVSEEGTKVNLHLFGSGLANQTVAVSMPELLLNEKPNGPSTFRIRMFNDGSTNIQNGEFAKIVTQMPEKDKAMVAALCGQIGKVSSSNEGFAASFAATEDRDAFRRSSFSSEPVREAISSLANQCVDEIRSKGLVNASFDVEAPMPVCSAAQNELLSKLDTEIDEAQTALQGFEDEIKALQVNRPLFERDACPAYQNDLASAQEKLSAIESEIAQSITSLADLEAKLAEGEDIKGSLSKISQPSELCDVEQNGLKDRVNGFIQNLNPAGTGVVCSDDTENNPLLVVIDEINADITRLLEIHISPDQIAELKNTIMQLEAERVELAATLAAVSQTKASPVEIDQQLQTNAGLNDTVSEIEGQVTALETEISELRGVMDDNASLISEIDQLNQELVSLNSQKMLTQGTLEDVKSKVLQAKATITQVEMQIDKVRSQTSDLEVQLVAASSTAGTLQQEVQTLTLEVAQTQKRIESLEQEVAVAQGLIDNANSVIASNSQEVAKLDAELNAKTATAITLKTSLDTLGPQADAAEQTVGDLEASLKADFVPVAQYKDQEARLNEMTQIVTERTKLIRELREDLQAIQGEEQLLVKMCLADAQCKAAMGDRLGVE